MRVLLAVAGACLLAATAACAPARVVVAGNPAGAVRLGGAGTSGGGWGNAELVRGLASLDKAGLPHVGGISCASPGNCVVGGFYDLSAVGYAEPTRAFVAGEMRGTWGVARQVPGLARLDKGPDSGVGYVSCLSAGSCTGTVSCASAGNCTVVGWYRPVPDRLVGPLASEPFVVSQVRGIWGTARPVPGFASLNAVAGSRRCHVLARVTAPRVATTRSRQGSSARRKPSLSMRCMAGGCGRGRRPAPRA